MTKKIIGAILMIIGGFQVIMRLVGSNAHPGMSAEGGGHLGQAAGHFAAVSSAFKVLGPLVIVIPIVFIIVGLILITHKDKAVKK